MLSFSACCEALFSKSGIIGVGLCLLLLGLLIVMVMRMGYSDVGEYDAERNLTYNNSRMSQFYMRFIRFNSVDWKDIYFLTYAQSIESNLMQMILAKEKLNLFMKGDEADMDDIYERFGVDYDLTSLLLYRDIDEDGHFSIRWGEQEIA